MLHRFYLYLLKNQVVLVLFLVVLGWFLLQIRGILVNLFVAYILASALLPFAMFLERRRFPKVLATAIPFLTATLLIFLIILPLIPFFSDQVGALIRGLPGYLDESARTLGFDVKDGSVQQIISREFNNIGRNAFSLTSKVFGGVFSTLTVIIISFYLLYYSDSFKQSIARLFHKGQHERVMETIEQVDDKLGSWLRGQLVLCFSIGLLTYISLSFIGLPYALPLALLAGAFEIIPTLGPIISAIPAIVVALTVSPTMAITVALIYVVIQILENNFLVPKIMQRAVGLNPVFVILAVAIGANLMGVFGALLSIPFVSFVTVLLQSINDTKRKD